MNPILLRKVFFPLYHRVIGSGVMDCLREIEKSQWLHPEEIVTLQKEKLCLLLRHAFDNVPFYRSRFKSVGISAMDLSDPDVLASIPILTKKEINENRDDMIAQNGVGGRLIANSTSGSTGEALYFFTDMRSSACRRAVFILNPEWVGIQFGDRMASLWGAAMDIDKLKNIRGRIHRCLNNYIILSSYDLSQKSLKKYIELMNQFCPILLISYPGPLTELAEFMIAKGFHIPSVHAIISSAETLHPWQKETAERAFNCHVYNRYGCREFGDIAHECERRKGLHINAHRVFLEILDENIRPCKPGVTGEFVITDLDNYGMPLIRYKIGDCGAYSNQVCSCGRGLPLLEGVEGRSIDIIHAPNGNRIGGTFWTLLLRSRPGIAAFQIIQEEIGGISVKYVRDRAVLDMPLTYFVKKIQDKCGENFRVDFQEVYQIEKTDSGKTRFVVSKIASP